MKTKIRDDSAKNEIPRHSKLCGLFNIKMSHSFENFNIFKTMRT